jgi:flavin reductase (DIM6/NTAB) family NADH-FMN oxidoreductase RutF
MTSLTLADRNPGQIYDLMAGLVAPRPIAFVSTISATGIANLAPFSYFNIGGLNPPSLTICTVDSPHGPKDTFANVLATSEFVVNLVNRSMAEGMNRTAQNFPQEVDEWPLSGFTPIESHHIKPPRVAESPVQIECRLFQTIKHGSGPGSSSYIIGELLVIHLDPAIYQEGQLTPPQLIARLGGNDYLDTESLVRFQLPRP